MRRAQDDRVTRATFDVYVVAANGRGPRVAISSGGGTDPHWRSDGAELFYVSAKEQLTAVPLLYQSGRIQPGQPDPLFQIADFEPRSPYLSAYDVSRDEMRILVREPRQDVHVAPLKVFLNWTWSRGAAPR
jgi:hypothetical protein